MEPDERGWVTLEAFCRSDRVTITRWAARRVLMNVPSRFRDGAPLDMLSFGGFVWFHQAEADRMADSSLDFWFRCLDHDEDGYLSPSDLARSFQEKQRELVGNVPAESAGELLQVEDVLCQLTDLIQPRLPSRITALDIRKANAGDIVYDVLLNKTESRAARNYLV